MSDPASQEGHISQSKSRKKGLIEGDTTEQSGKKNAHRTARDTKDRRVHEGRTVEGSLFVLPGWDKEKKELVKGGLGTSDKHTVHESFGVVFPRGGCTQPEGGIKTVIHRPR